MKKLLLVSLFAAACGKSPAKKCDFDGNPAIAQVCGAVKDAKCRTVARDLGEKHVFTAQCEMPNQDVFSISWNVDKPFEIESRLLVPGPETQKRQAEADAKAKEQELAEAKKKLQEATTPSPPPPGQGSGANAPIPDAGASK